MRGTIAFIYTRKSKLSIDMLAKSRAINEFDI